MRVPARMEESCFFNQQGATNSLKSVQLVFGNHGACNKSITPRSTSKEVPGLDSEWRAVLKNQSQKRSSVQGSP